MTQIKNILTAGLVVYLLIAVWQGTSRPEIFLQALALGVLLIILTGIAWISDEEVLKRTEMVILWICVGLFGLYAMLVAGGVV
jgi:FtsH-binding integral membrane protein